MEPKFPDVEVQLTGHDGNAYAIIARVVRGMERAGYREEAKEFAHAAMESESYDDLLMLAMRTVDVH